jgi:hypothetical protein
MLGPQLTQPNFSTLSGQIFVIFAQIFIFIFYILVELFQHAWLDACGVTLAYPIKLNIEPITPSANFLRWRHLDFAEITASPL